MNQIYLDLLIENMILLEWILVYQEIFNSTVFGPTELNLIQGESKIITTCRKYIKNVFYYNLLVKEILKSIRVQKRTLNFYHFILYFFILCIKELKTLPNLQIGLGILVRDIRSRIIGSALL